MTVRRAVKGGNGRRRACECWEMGATGPAGQQPRSGVPGCRRRVRGWIDAGTPGAADESATPGALVTGEIRILWVRCVSFGFHRRARLGSRLLQRDTAACVPVVPGPGTVSTAASYLAVVSPYCPNASGEPCTRTASRPSTAPAVVVAAQPLTSVTTINPRKRPVKRFVRSCKCKSGNRLC